MLVPLFPFVLVSGLMLPPTGSAWWKEHCQTFMREGERRIWLNKMLSGAFWVTFSKMIRKPNNVHSITFLHTNCFSTLCNVQWVTSNALSVGVGEARLESRALLSNVFTCPKVHDRRGFFRIQTCTAGHLPEIFLLFLDKHYDG